MIITFTLYIYVLIEKKVNTKLLFTCMKVQKCFFFFVITNYDTHTLTHPAHYVVKNVTLIATQ